LNTLIEDQPAVLLSQSPHGTAEKSGKPALPLLSVVPDLLSCCCHLRTLFTIRRQLLQDFRRIVNVKEYY
jgi:hypothetical protein